MIRLFQMIAADGKKSLGQRETDLTPLSLAPILFCKACESTTMRVFIRFVYSWDVCPVFISEVTARAFIIADSNKRRTLSRADIAKALSKSDQFDFLIDIVPREDGMGAKRVGGSES